MAFSCMNLFSICLCVKISTLSRSAWILPSDRHWLLVAWSADFANVEPTLAIGRIISIFCQCWSNVGPTVGIGRIISRFCQCRANVGPTVACQPQLRLDISIFCRHWANIGPTVDFYSRWRRANIGDFVKLSKKLFIMICLKIIFQ